jgi:hypothetical protein
MYIISTVKVKYKSIQIIISKSFWVCYVCINDSCGVAVHFIGKKCVWLLISYAKLILILFTAFT